MDDPVAKALHGLLDHSVETDRRLQAILARLEAAGISSTIRSPTGDPSTGVCRGWWIDPLVPSRVSRRPVFAPILRGLSPPGPVVDRFVGILYSTKMMDIRPPSGAVRARRAFEEEPHATYDQGTVCGDRDDRPGCAPGTDPSRWRVSPSARAYRCPTSSNSSASCARLKAGQWRAWSGRWLPAGAGDGRDHGGRHHHRGRQAMDATQCGGRKTATTVTSDDPPPVVQPSTSASTPTSIR